MYIHILFTHKLIHYIQLQFILHSLIVTICHMVFFILPLSPWSYLSPSSLSGSLYGWYYQKRAQLIVLLLVRWCRGVVRARGVRLVCCLVVGPCEAKIVLMLAASFNSCRSSRFVKLDQSLKYYIFYPKIYCLEGFTLQQSPLLIFLFSKRPGVWVESQK